MFTRLASLLMVAGALMLILSPSTEATAAVQYDAILEWNGPNYRVVNSSGLNQLVDIPAADIPFSNPTAIAGITHSGRKVIYVVDSGNNRVQVFEVNATYNNTDASAFTFAGGGASAALEADDDEILLGEWAATADTWVVPYSESIVIDGTKWNWVNDVSGFVAADKVYTIDYDATSNGPQIDFPASSLTSDSVYEIRYLITDNQTGAADAFGIGDVDYGVGAGASPVLTKITEASGGPSSFEQLRSVALIANEATATTDDVFLVDSADNSGNQNEELFLYTVTDAGVVAFVEAYDDVLDGPWDVAVARSAASTAATVTLDDSGPFDTVPTITDASQITGHTYTVTVAGTDVSVTDATTGRVLLDTAAFADLDDPFLGIPGVSLDLNGAIGTSNTITTARAVSNRYLFVTDTGNDRIKVVSAGDGAGASWPGDWLPGDVRSVDAQPLATIGDDAAVDYSVATPATVPEDFVSWTTAFPIKEGTLSSITFDPDGTPEEWTRIDNLSVAGPNDLVYEVDWTNGMIRFGDGIHGQLPPASTTFEYTYATTPDVMRYGTTGTGPARFNSPRGIAARWNSGTGSYDVYVADTGNNRIQKLAFIPGNASLGLQPRMSYVTEWKVAADEADFLDTPTDIAVLADGSGTVWLTVSDQGNDRIVTYTDAGALTGSSAVPTFDSAFGTTGNNLGQYASVAGVALMANGTDIDIYTADETRDIVAKYEESPTPTLSLTWTGTGICVPPTSTFTFGITTTNAPETGWIDFYYDSVSTFNSATAKLLFPAQSVAAQETSVTWVIANTPGGVPADGTYYIFARMKNIAGNTVAADVTTGTETVCIDSTLRSTLRASDSIDGDDRLYMQNGLERTVTLELLYPDNIIGVSYQGTFDPTMFEIVRIAQGSAWEGIGATDVLFTEDFDNVAGTFQVNSTVIASPIGLSANGPHEIAEVTLRAKDDAISASNRVRAGVLDLLPSSDMTNVDGDTPSDLTINDLGVRIAYLGDVATTGAAPEAAAPAMKQNPDGVYDFADQMMFTLGWNGASGVQDPIADLGPASGAAPDMLSIPDKGWDVDDILVFTSMFSWAAAEGFTTPGGGARLAAGNFTHGPSTLGAAVNGPARVYTQSYVGSVIPGSEFAVQVRVDNAENLVGSLLQLHYDASQYEFLGAENGDLLRGADGSLFFDRAGSDWVEVAVSRLDRLNPGASGSGVLAELRFRLLEGGTEEFELSYDLRDVNNGVLVRGSSGTGPFTGGPATFQLYRSYPNPMGTNANVVFSLAQKSDVALRVFDTSGRLVRTLAQGTHESGFHVVNFDGKSDAHETLPGGVYFYQLVTPDGQTATQKLMIAR